VSIIPGFKDPNDLLLKLCRESINVYKSTTGEEVLDRFFNFCVTAHSLRDWIIKSSGLNPNTVHGYCNNFDYLRMCRDVANATKHFGLDPGKESSVSLIGEKELSYRPMVPGKLDPKEIVKQPSLEVLDQSGKQFNLTDFMNHSIESWINVFDHFAVTREKKLFYTKSLAFAVGNYNVAFIYR